MELLKNGLTGATLFPATDPSGNTALVCTVAASRWLATKIRKAFPAALILPQESAGQFNSRDELVVGFRKTSRGQD